MVNFEDMKIGVLYTWRGGLSYLFEKANSNGVVEKFLMGTQFIILEKVPSDKTLRVMLLGTALIAFTQPFEWFPVVEYVSS